MIVSPSLYPLIAALLANVAAQVLKLFNYYFRSGRWDLHQVISCGGFMIGQILASFTKMDRLLNAAGGLVLLGIGIKILYEHQAFDLIFD